MSKRGNPNNRTSGTRGKVLRAKQRVKIADMYLSGMRQIDIAAQLGISQASVSNQINRAKKDWLTNSADTVSEYVAIEDEKLKKVEREAWDIWDEAVKNYKNQIFDEATGALMSPDKFPPASYLQAVIKAVQMRFRLYGFEARESQEALKNLLQQAGEARAPQFFLPELDPAPEITPEKEE